MVSKDRIEQLLQEINEGINHLENSLNTAVEDEKSAIFMDYSEAHSTGKNQIAKKMANLEKTLFHYNTDGQK